MKKYGVVTSIMLFSTMLGVALPIPSIVGDKYGIGSSETMTAKADDTSDLNAEILAQVKLDATVNLPNTNADTIQVLKAAFDKKVANGTASTDIALPIDWESAAQLVVTFANRRKEQIANEGLTASDAANSVVTAQEQYTDPQALVKYATKTTGIKSISIFLSQKVLAPYINTKINGERNAVGTETKPTEAQVADAKFLIEKIADARKEVVNNLASASDEAKADTSSAIDDAVTSDEKELDSDTMTVPTLTYGAYQQFKNLGPVNDFDAVTDQDKTAALATLKGNYDDAMSKLTAVTGFDTDVKAAKDRVEAVYTKYQTVINDVKTQGALSKAQTDGDWDLRTAIILNPTDAEKTAGINAINAAVTAQTAIINADTQASDAEKATAIKTINNTANQYIPMINASNTTVQVLATAQAAAVSTIKATTAMHTQAITTAQRNAAMNAVITAGNTKKVAIQNDASIAAADKTAAYAAVDKLVTSYTDQMKTAKLTTDLTKLQTTGVAAVTAFQATKSATAATTTTTTTTEPTTTDATNTVAKASAKKVLYAISGLKLYKSDSLKGKTVASYAKHKRTNRPTFLVTKTVKNDAGKKVYYVQNQASGKKGYITSSTKSVAYAYYQTTPKKVQVITKGGVNQYKKANLSTKQKHYKKGQTLKVKKLIKSGVTTRFQLTNGSYISANKKFVIDTQY